MHFGLGHIGDTMVVCPSISFPAVELRKITGIVHYEERALFTLLALDRPGVHVVYITSVPIDPAIVDYYLGFVSDPSDALGRLTLVALDDPEPRALSAKLLDRPDVVATVRAALRGRSGFLLPFNVTDAEATLAAALDVPLLGASPALTHLGSKSGARRLAKENGVEVLCGAEDLRSVDEVSTALRDLSARRPEARAAVVKLNNGFSGQGNAIVSLDGLAPSLDARSTVYCAVEESFASFAHKIAAEGAIVEELFRAPGLASPSVQLWVESPDEVSVVSTHDQMLGGPDDQVYLGCRFPAERAYRDAISWRATVIGRALAERGVLGPFGIDFIVLPDGDDPRVWLSEINLRMGGTTHPFAMAELVTQGRYDVSTGELWVGERPKRYVASDNLKSAAYEGLTPGAVIDAVRGCGAAYDARRGTGVTLHLLGAVTHFGKMGVTCIGYSAGESADLYSPAVAAIDDLASS
jgi:hypothetical protein